ncbi:hypothetical protein GCM10009838_04850 [Catenulispora subtropica]|uniref:Uncharacterized protein n=1 Tax=Catenulispora subtropica TaxID=450798 RepID=A0ABN2QKH7_9ACTN
MATAAYHDLKDRGTFHGSDFRANLEALSHELGRYQIDVDITEPLNNDNVGEAVRSAADSAARQVGTELLQVIGALAALFANFAVAAESSPEPINVTAYLQATGLKNLIVGDDS